MFLASAIAMTDGEYSMVAMTETSPDAWGGVVAVICVGLSTVNWTEVPPIVTLLTPMKLVPVIMTVCPPAVGPVFGEMSDIIRGSANDTETGRAIRMKRTRLSIFSAGCRLTV
ncbi:MAG: hypothetical protein A3C15_03520 [Candidatus Magasanikbacteria bacterium RIFCSPHIGHO2_02_FULL_50_9b]|uniref:Uncharacterized protein n=1 Tax=Candidatus Magasanikbacteria bacterium RIFCSPHIGHO2_02_FULL_50_9b TaxID=1798682 RepID=A0A1F6M9E5_9BACT|nr:MAG: hypothetical protein A3C15_03520 [Candidatus Magasanikbacteria bacterium RIFCSPHIGHO2_02_FULL_50_9b]